jgi:hypothetical protein
MKEPEVMQIVLWLSEPYKIGRVSDGVSKRTLMVDISWKMKRFGGWKAGEGRMNVHRKRKAELSSVRRRCNLVAAGSNQVSGVLHTPACRLSQCTTRP